MLRFDSKKHQRRSANQRPTRGVWMLLLLLGAVMMLMKQLQRPETASLLGQFFTTSSAPKAADESARDLNPTAPASSARANRPTPAQLKSGPWAAVKDNATFLPAETEAWFLLWDEVQRKEPRELEQVAVGELAYAQFVEQPDVYRGQPVRIRGRVLREEIKQAPTNALGIQSYHLLTVAPRGGGDWPLRVYCLKLPADFPRGSDLAVDVEVVGLFFKNWSYAYEGGLGLAPVIVTRTVNWQSPRPAKSVDRHDADAFGGWAALAAAGVAATVFLVAVLRQTRRPRAVETLVPDFESLDGNS